jgi:23S rRNA pseudouridine1911/1915/1917 synthase
MSSLNTLKTNPDYTDGVEVSTPEGATLAIAATAGVGLRIDKFLSLALEGVSRTRVQKWIALGAVRVDDAPVAGKLKLKGFENVEVDVLPIDADTAFEPDDVELAVVATTPDYLVINKSADLVVHPGPGNWRMTIMNGLLFHFPDSATLPRAGIVHRLDKDTTGLMVVARTEPTRAHLVDLLARHDVERTYWALVWGIVNRRGKIDQPIGRDPHNRLKMAIVASAKAAVSHYELIADGSLGNRPVSLVEVKLETGRTHQIRVHFQSIGHPLVGDVTYTGGAPTQAAAIVSKGFARQALHAKRLKFKNAPKAILNAAKEQLFESPLPSDFSALLVSAGINL